MEDRKKNNFPEKEMLQRFLNGELNESEIEIFIAQVKFNSPENEYGAGVKNFLESNNYNVQKILMWRNIARKRAENKLINKLTSSTNKWLKIAAVLIIGFSTYFLISHTNNSTPSWETTYKKDLGFPVFMGDKNSNQWMESYRASNYSESLKLINEELKINPTNDTLLYCRIVCLFETNSLQITKPISIAKDQYYFEKTQLIFAYQYWKNDRINKAIDIFAGL